MTLGTADRTGDGPGVPARPDRGLRGVLRRLRSTESELDAEQLEDAAVGSGADRIRDCECGSSTTVVGRLRSVTLRPGQQTPAVEATLYDGTGEMRLLFLGRRRIPGITAGRQLAARGRPVVRDGVRMMINPRYELLPTGPGPE